MSFVSYAQNYEDVMLGRALAGVERGFYVDVGAQDPRFDSVTKAFYDQGWHGINLEPVEYWHRRLLAERPRDINLCLAAGDHEGFIEFHETEQSGLSTASAEFARRHREQGHALRTRRVPVSTLDAICRAHDVREVHFLKVDVEGAEVEVLRGLDLSRLRPWIILVEATEPNSRVSTHALWEALVTDHDYRMCYQDGLNRYYLAREHEDLAPAFDAPPNIFDDFVRRELMDLGTMLGERITGLEAQIGQVQTLADARGDQIAHRDAELASTQAERDAAQAQRDSAQAERNLAQAGRDTTQTELNAARAELDATRSRETALADALEREHALSARRLAEIDRLQSELKESRDAHAASQDQIDQLVVRLARTEQSLAKLARELADARAEQHGTLDAYTRELAAHADTLAELGRAQADFQQLVSSRSWRVTAPLRRAMALGAAGRERAVGTFRGLSRYRSLRALAAGLVAPFPGLAQRLKRRLYGEPTAIDTPEADTRPEQAAEPLPLTRDALEIMARWPVLTDTADREEDA